MSSRFVAEGLQIELSLRACASPSLPAFGAEALQIELSLRACASPSLPAFVASVLQIELSLSACASPSLPAFGAEALQIVLWQRLSHWAIHSEQSLGRSATWAIWWQKPEISILSCESSALEQTKGIQSRGNTSPSIEVIFCAM